MPSADGASVAGPGEPTHASASGPLQGVRAGVFEQPRRQRLSRSRSVSGAPSCEGVARQSMTDRSRARMRGATLRVEATMGRQGERMSRAGGCGAGVRVGVDAVGAIGRQAGLRGLRAGAGRPRGERQRRRDAAVRLFGEPDAAAGFKGAPGVDPPAPELVHVKADDPNRLGKFEFELMTPNQWSGVTLEIKGQPDQDGRTPRDDVSGYKALSMQVFATGVATVRVEVLSRGWEQDTHDGQPADHVPAQAGAQHLSCRAEEIRAALMGDRYPNRPEGRAEEPDRRHDLGLL